MYNRKVFNARQTAALSGLYLWRDRVARQQDESIGFVAYLSLNCTKYCLVTADVPLSNYSLGHYLSVTPKFYTKQPV